MYAAEWPCCHDPLRFSLGSDDLLRARNNPRSEPRQGLSRSAVALSALSPLASPPSLTRSGAEPRGRERDFCPRQRAGHCADTPGSPRAATGRSRGPLRAECGLRSGRRERLSLLRAFHALLCVPKHALLFYSITHKTPPLPLSLDLGPCALGRGVARHARGSPAAWERAPARLAGGVRRTLSA